MRETLGYLPQEFGVYPKVSAEQLLDHFAVLKGITDRPAGAQGFGFAVALLGHPKLIVVDEPPRSRPGRAGITVTVPGKPARAGIDPRSLLNDVEVKNNLRDIERG